MKKGDKSKKVLDAIVILAIIVSVFGGVVSAEDVSGNLTENVADVEIQTVVVGYNSDLPVTGKGIWIWKIWELDESVSEIIDQLQNAGVEWVTIKCGDSDSYYLTPGRKMYNWLITNGYSDFGEVVTQFHDAGIKVIGWQYVWSYDKWSVPGVSETDVSNQILDIAGIDGLIINAEGEYEGEGKGVIAKQYMEDIRAEHPNSFMAYSTFAIIDYHPWFPYLEFGKYCDAVMPQDYWKEFGKTPTETVDWMKQQWDKWHAIWASGGHGDSIKPIIPTGQGYGGVSGNEITEFCNAISGYGYRGVSLWRYGLMTDEIWDAYATKRPPIAHASDISNQPDVMHPDTLYEVTAKYYDPDGRSNLDLCTLVLSHPSDIIMMGWDEDHKMPVEDSPYITYLDVVYTQITDSYEGYQLTWKFKLSDTWPEAENCIDFCVVATDDDGLRSESDCDNTDASFVVNQPDIRTPISSISFGDVTVGNSLDKTTTIYNDGTGTLTVNSITRSSGSYEFTYIGPSTPFDIAASGSRAITVRFAPSSTGSKSANFNVNSNDPDEANVLFSVSGNGINVPTCDGTATSCGIYPNCENCNAKDGCYQYDNGCEERDYYCKSNEEGCGYTTSNRHTDYSDDWVYYCDGDTVRKHRLGHNYYCDGGTCTDHTSMEDDQLVENCNDHDGWVDTGDTDWVEVNECQEKELKEQKYRDYACSGGACTYSVTGTQWVDTGNTQSKDDGTICGCTASNTLKSCYGGVCTDTGICDSTTCSADAACDGKEPGDSCGGGICDSNCKCRGQVGEDIAIRYNNGWWEFKYGLVAEILNFQPADHWLAYGTGTGTPIVGDFNADNIDDIGIRYNNGWWEFKYGPVAEILNFQPADHWLAYGTGAGTPIVGDFNADNIDDLGIRYNSGWWEFKYGSVAEILNCQPADHWLAYGTGTGTPIVGDFENNGIDDLGIRYNNGWWEFKYGLVAEILNFQPADHWLAYGIGTGIPLVGSFNP